MANRYHLFLQAMKCKESQQNPREAISSTACYIHDTVLGLREYLWAFCLLSCCISVVFVCCLYSQAGPGCKEGQAVPAKFGGATVVLWKVICFCLMVFHNVIKILNWCRWRVKMKHLHFLRGAAALTKLGSQTRMMRLWK